MTHTTIHSAGIAFQLNICNISIEQKLKQTREVVTSLIRSENSIEPWEFPDGGGKEPDLEALKDSVGTIRMEVDEVEDKHLSPRRDICLYSGGSRRKSKGRIEKRQDFIEIWAIKGKDAISNSA